MPDAPDDRPRIERLGDAGLLLRWPLADATAANAQVHALAARMAAVAPPWIEDIVPGIASLGLLLDPTAPADALQAVEHWARLLVDESTMAEEAPDDRPIVEVPVCYAPEFGIDLPVLAEASKLSITEIIAAHTAPTYRVAMVGFAPGFPYLLGLDPRLALPRLSTPRPRVEAGSVGIGGPQTGIYPQAGPGGWRLVGRTPLRLFDPTRAAASLLAPGDRVQFVAIDRDSFRALSA